MKIDREASLAAIEKMGEQLGLSMEETAAGIIRVVTANMARAIRLISVQRGHDPRDYCLMPFGGGGPVHAGRLARELAMERILVPRNPGILCALGLLLTDIRRDFSVTRRLVVESANLSTIHETVAKLIAEAKAWFEAEAIETGRRRTVASADMRYAGQNYELNVSIPDPANSDLFLGNLVDNFNQAYQRQYNYTAPEEAIEIVTFRVEAYGLVEKPEFEEDTEEGQDASAALVTHRLVYQPEMGEFIQSPVYDRDQLRAGNIVEGPAIVEQMDSTTLVLPGQVCCVDTHSNLLIREHAMR